MMDNRRYTRRSTSIRRHANSKLSILENYQNRNTTGSLYISDQEIKLRAQDIFKSLVQKLFDPNQFLYQVENPGNDALPVTINHEEEANQDKIYYITSEKFLQAIKSHHLLEFIKNIKRPHFRIDKNQI